MGFEFICQEVSKGVKHGNRQSNHKLMNYATHGTKNR